MTYSTLFGGMLVLLAGACSNESPTYNPGTAGATAGTSGGGSGGVATGTAIAGAWTADYFLAQIKWWLGEQQTLNTFNIGTTLLF